MRVLVRIISALIGLAIAAAGLLAALEVAWAWVFPDKNPLIVPWRQWRTDYGKLPWSDTWVQVVAGGAVIVGLLFLLFAFSARRNRIRLNDPSPDVSVETSPRSLARVISHSVREQEGVHSTSVTASSRKIKVRADSRFQSSDELRPRVTETVDEVVDSLPLPTKPRVSVVVHTRKDLT